MRQKGMKISLKGYRVFLKAINFKKILKKNI